MPKVTTLVYFLNENNEILLAMKKRGFGTGIVNGVGGKVEENETIEAAAAREAVEECGLVPKALEFRGIVDFVYENKPNWDSACHVFICKQYDGTMVETEEMKPEWYKCDNLPIEKMWGDDVIWLPGVIAGGDVRARYYFDAHGKMLRHEPLPDDFTVDVVLR